MDKTKYTDMFIEEAREHLEILNNTLLSLEKNGYNEEDLKEIYRIMHTMKGTANVVGATAIGEISHEAEDLLDILRSKGEQPGTSIMDLLFKTADLIEKMVAELAEKGTITSDGYAVIAYLKEAKKRDEAEGNDNNDISGANSSFTDLTQEEAFIAEKAEEDGLSIYKLEVGLREDMRFKEGRVFQLMNKLKEIGSIIAMFPKADSITDDVNTVRFFFASSEDKDIIDGTALSITGVKGAIIATLSTSNEQTEVAQEGKKKDYEVAKVETVRVKSKLLDQLLDLVGEIMISNIQVNQIATDIRNRELKQVLKVNEHLISELQDTVLNMRMVPLDRIFKRFPRMVRDMARDNDKDVVFKTSGGDIEIDRSLLDQIGDSLLHILRNAVDHGIECENDREAVGKSCRGSITLSAHQDGGSIIITIQDDGKGIDLEKLKTKLVEKEEISAEHAKTITDAQLTPYLFQSGISTAAEVTEISGRGVGLDVVKNKVETLGGSVRIDSKKGEGTVVTVKLPPSMAIIGAMLVEISGERYAIPLENAMETTMLPASEVHEVLDKGVFQLREEILPLLNIHVKFGGEELAPGKHMPVLVVEKDDQRAGLVVTRFIGQQEIVVKNVGKQLKDAQYFSDATILGDGKVALILDVGSLMKRI